MNKKVFISMLILTISFLVSLYVLKIFFPQEFVMSIQNERLIEIGTYIDSHQWSYYLFGICTSFLTYWLYLCAVCHKKWLGMKEILAILITIALSIGSQFIDPNFATYMSIFPMIILPCIFRANLRDVTIVYSVHGLAQILSLSIRNLPMYIQYFNSLFFMFMTIEMYFWLLLFYIILNYKKKEI